MGRCEYVDESASFLDGWHCSITGRHVDDSDIVRHYCRDSIDCRHCPYRGGDDRLRKPHQEAPVPEEPAHPIYSEPVPSKPARPSRTGYGTDASSTYTGGGSWRSYRRNRGKTIALLSVIALIAALVFGGTLLGILGPWVDMHLPEGTVVPKASLLTVGRGENGSPLFAARSGAFDQEGYAHAVAPTGTSDVYYREDNACVWLGTTDLLMLNTSVVYDIGYDEIRSLLVRPLLVTLTDTDGTPISAPLTVTDESGQSVQCTALSAGSYVLLLPDDSRSPSLTFCAEGYRSFTAQPDLSDRLSQAHIKLSEEGGAPR